MLLAISRILLFCAIIISVLIDIFTCQKEMIFRNKKKIPRSKYIMIKGIALLFYVIIFMIISQNAVSIMRLAILVCLIDNIISNVLFGHTPIRNESKYNTMTFLQVGLIIVLIVLLLLVKLF